MFSTFIVENFTTCQYVIHTHGNKVNSKSVVFARHLGDLELCANPISATDQYGILVASQSQIKGSAKPTCFC